MIRCDYVISRSCQRQHDPPPAICKLREAVEKQDAWSALGLETRLQHVHREPVDVVNNPGADACRERGIAIGREVGVIRVDNGRSRITLSEREAANCASEGCLTEVAAVSVDLS